MHASLLKRDIDELGARRVEARAWLGRMSSLLRTSVKGEECAGSVYLDQSAAFDCILCEFLIADSTYNVQLLQSSAQGVEHQR